MSVQPSGGEDGWEWAAFISSFVVVAVELVTAPKGCIFRFAKLYPFHGLKCKTKITILIIMNPSLPSRTTVGADSIEFEKKRKID